MKLPHSLIAVILAHAGFCEAQVSDSIARRAVFRQNFLAPTVLISTGLLTLTDNEVFDKWEINEVREAHFHNFRTYADNYIQFAPIAAAYALDAFKIQGKHKIMPKTMMLLKSEVFMMVMVFPMKNLIGTPRPDTGVRNSFPSGHTAQAFAAATFFHKEYGHLSPWYSIGAYSVAASVGVMRVLNDRHWISDVFVGAGLGILATNLAYLTERKTKHARHVAFSKVRFTPIYSQRSFGFALSGKL